MITYLTFFFGFKFKVWISNQKYIHCSLSKAVAKLVAKSNDPWKHICINVAKFVFCFVMYGLRLFVCCILIKILKTVLTAAVNKDVLHSATQEFVNKKKGCFLKEKTIEITHTKCVRRFERPKCKCSWLYWLKSYQDSRFSIHCLVVLVIVVAVAVPVLIMCTVTE